jgi:hypothetical protein
MKIFIPIHLLAFCLVSPVLAEEPATIPAKIFETPVDASDAFIKAAQNGEQKAILEIFGNKHKELIGTAEPERDKELRANVAAMAVERRRFRFNDENSVTMVIGAEAWPFPVPIVKTDKGWHFDSDTGIEEIVKRRIGENELSAIATMRAYVDAQREYASVSRDDSKVRQFARKFQSSPGQHDGLHWPTDVEKGESPSPAGPEIKDSEAPHDGYRYKILTAQGESAPGGKYDYIINGHFIGGFALIAWPAEYGKTGVMSFLINHYGAVHEKDLGPETASIAIKTESYDPGEGWSETPE